MNRQENQSGADEPQVTPEDGPYLRRCPACHHILARYRVGHGVAFLIDRCRNCNGLWFDRDEWQALRSRNLLHLLPHLTSDEWQRELHQADLQAQEEARLLSELDPEDLTRIREIKAWLDAHAKRMTLFRVLGIEPEHVPKPKQTS